ncbi:MAG: carbohydrate porin [Coleofasciculaceae cyanobacterium SM2_3_26]|nr:carbohydrate porin [Coleofasciculaceae cyanobacterium SM2_3_26]
MLTFLQLALSNQIGIFGRFGHGRFDNTNFGDLSPTYWMAGISLIDVGLTGSRSGIAVGQPFAEGDVGNATQINIEAFYAIPINSNLQVTPLVQVITNAGNQDSNGAIITGTLRTVFFF